MDDDKALDYSVDLLQKVERLERQRLDARLRINGAGDYQCLCGCDLFRVQRDRIECSRCSRETDLRTLEVARSQPAI